MSEIRPTPSSLLDFMVESGVVGTNRCFYDVFDQSLIRDVVDDITSGLFRDGYVKQEFKLMTEKILQEVSESSMLSIPSEKRADQRKHIFEAFRKGVRT